MSRRERWLPPARTAYCEWVSSSCADAALRWAAGAGGGPGLPVLLPFTAAVLCASVIVVCAAASAIWSKPFMPLNRIELRFVVELSIETAGGTVSSVSSVSQYVW